MNWDGSDIEPRLRNASLANPLVANLPFAQLHMYHRAARVVHMSADNIAQRHHQMSLVKTGPLKIHRRPATSGYTYG